MPSSYDQAVEAIHRAPLEQFVAERKRLAAELKASGDKDAAKRLLEFKRPVVSAWAVNQLWWQARPAFQDLLAAAQRLRDGDLRASDQHRDALAKLRASAGGLLGAAGHAPNDATLRRVTGTLLALAARGGFEPDPPGALAADRDPPGFDALSLVAEAAPTATELAPAQATATTAARDAEQQRQAAELERQRLEQQRLEREARLKRMRESLAIADAEIVRAGREVERLRGELADAERRLHDVRARRSQLERELGAVEGGQDV